MTGFLSSQQAEQAIAELYQSESRAVLATLIRLLGDFDLAEEALHEAFRAALEQWPQQGLPENPRNWLISTGRFRMVDRLRRSSRIELLGDAAEALIDDSQDQRLEADDLEDDALRLIFTCCHPALVREAQLALTLREVCALTTEAIASAFLSKPATIAQRIVRAKQKIRRAKIAYEVPTRNELAPRLDAVLQVIYLVFNEGYKASSGDQLTRADLSAEAIRLAERLHSLMPEAEVKGLLALMLLHESRRQARLDADGDVVLLDAQDRNLWQQDLIRQGVALVEQALRSKQFGRYSLQAAIAAVHAEAPSAEQTDWAQITALYDVLLQHQPSPVIALNHAVALAMRDGPEAGLQQIRAVMADGALDDYYLAHAAMADMLRRLGRDREARGAYLRALALTELAAEQRFLQSRIDRLSAD